MLGLVCGNFGGQGLLHLLLINPAALIFSGMAAFLDESLDPFAYVNSRRRKRAGAVAEWGTSFTR